MLSTFMKMLPALLVATLPFVAHAQDARRPAGASLYSGPTVRASRSELTDMAIKNEILRRGEPLTGTSIYNSAYNSVLVGGCIYQIQNDSSSSGTNQSGGKTLAQSTSNCTNNGQVSGQLNANGPGNITQKK